MPSIGLGGQEHGQSLLNSSDPPSAIIDFHWFCICNPGGYPACTAPAPRSRMPAACWP